MGEVFAGRYELVDLIGQGGMGSVWRVFDHRRREFCAAKVLRQSDAATLLRFVREQTLRIRHPHVVAPRNWAAEDDRVLFTMDLVRGGSVATLLNDHGPLPSGYVAVLLDQLLDALQAVHESGVVHRDIKPANLLLDPTGRGRPFMRLTDFGIAVRTDEPRLTSTGWVLGTPGYLPPEAWRQSDPEPRQDLFSAGLLCAELLTGDRQAPDTRDFDGLASCPPGVHDGLWALLQRLSAVDPADRPESAAAARELLRGLRAGELPLVAPPGTTAAWNPGSEAVEVFDQVGPVPEGWEPRAAPLGATRPAGGRPADPQDAEATHPLADRRPPEQPLSWRRIALAAVVVGVAFGLAATQLPWPDGAPDEIAQGAECAWVDAGEQVVADGRTLTCQRTEDGGYRWSED